MSLLGLMKVLKPDVLVKAIKQNKTTILSLVASGGVIATGYFAAKGAVELKEELDEKPEAPVKEKIVTTAKHMAPAVASAGVTIFCIWKNQSIHVKKEASLASLATYWHKRYKELDDKIELKLGPEETKKIKEEIIQDNIAKKEIPKGYLPPGTFWCYDPITEQFIKTSGHMITWAAYMVNMQFARFGNVDYNYFITLLGGKKTKLGSEIGWSYDNEDLIEVMDYNSGYGLGYLIDIWADVLCEDAANPKYEGASVPHLCFQYEPQSLDGEKEKTKLRNILELQKEGWCNV